MDMRDKTGTHIQQSIIHSLREVKFYYWQKYGLTQRLSHKSEIHQQEKNKYYILMHICGIWKSGTDEPICKAKIETQI